MDEREVLARQIYEVWSREGPAVAAERHFAEDVAWSDPPETPDAAVLRGREEVVGLWHEREPILGTFHVELENATSVGDELMTSVRIRSRSDRGFQMDFRHFHLLLFRAGKLARIKVFSTREDAQQAAGEPEGAPEEAGG